MSVVVPASEGGVDDGRVGFVVSPCSFFFFLSSDFIWQTSVFSSRFDPASTLGLSSSSFMSSSLIPPVCFRSLPDAGEAEEREERVATTTGQEGFSSFIADVEATESLVFVASLSVSIGSIQSDTAEEPDRHKTTSFPESSVGFSVGVCFS